jgi:chromosomal replication initiation ATPase DnaA
MTPDEARGLIEDAIAAHRKRVAAADDRLRAEVLVILDDLKDGAPTVPGVTPAMKEAVRRALWGGQPIHRVLEATAELTGVGAGQLTGVRQHKEIADARMLAMAVCCAWRLGSLPQIGKVFNRDHSTVANARNQIAARMTPALAAAMETIAASAGLGPRPDSPGARAAEAA